MKIDYKEPRIIDNINDRLISFEKLKNHVGWVPKYSIYDGIIKTLDYFKQNYKLNDNIK